MKLDGVWRALPATDALRRNGIGVDVDDASWPAVEVPGHWRHQTDLGTRDGPVLYRRAFDVAPPEAGTRRWLRFDGVFYQADVWLDGAYVGDPEGYFAPHAYDVTELSRLDEHHTVAVEVSCAAQPDPRAQRNITGTFQGGLGARRDWNPGGIWGSVSLEDTGPARLSALRVLCRDADPHRAHLLLTANIDIDAGQRITLRTLVDGVEIASSVHQLATGTNDVSWSIDIGEPSLWWPAELGPQPLTTVEVEVIIDGEVSDRAHRRTGLREVAWKDWQCTVNGERLFLRGVNLLPTRLALAEATPTDCRTDIERAVAAGFNTVRLNSHVALADTYRAADELGVLVLQDFPMHWGYQRTVRRAALRQARAMVDALGHHPSVVHWSAHSDPGAVNLGLSETSGLSTVREAALHQVPTWNRSVLDRVVKREIERADPTRPVSRSSGVLPRLANPGGADTHFFFGWYHGLLEDVRTTARQAPHLLRFVSAFGTQSVPLSQLDEHANSPSHPWPHIDWEQRGLSPLQRSPFDKHVPPSHYTNAAEWAVATQLYQAQALQYQIELFRRMKYRPTGGFAVYCLNDTHPGASFAIFDDVGNPKLAVEAARTANQRIVAIADPMPTRAKPGSNVTMNLLVVNDERITRRTVRLETTVTAEGFSLRRDFSGTLTPDSVVSVATLAFTMPTTITSVELTLLDETVPLSTNRYRISPIGPNASDVAAREPDDATSPNTVAARSTNGVAG